MQKIKFPIVFLLIVFFLVGCQNSDLGERDSSGDSNLLSTSDNEESSLESETGDESYPGPVSGDENGYPSSNIESSNDIDATYPGPERVVDESKRFDIAEPIVPGQLTISGTGPANVTIRIVSVSNSGETLATGLIDQDGAFSFPLNRELDSKEAIAIMLADESMREQFIDAPGATDIPLTGFILDMASTYQP